MPTPIFSFTRPSLVEVALLIDKRIIRSADEAFKSVLGNSSRLSGRMLHERNAGRQDGRMGFAETAQSLIDRSGKSQRQVAKLVGVASSTISRWLSGGTPPDLETASRMADVLEVSLDQLSGRVEWDLDREYLEREIRRLGAREVLRRVMAFHGAIEPSKGPAMKAVSDVDMSPRRVRGRGRSRKSD